VCPATAALVVMIGRLEALMVYESIRDLLPATAPTWTFRMSIGCVFQDHPAHIPRGPARQPWVRGSARQ
jgi:hypothetical protein